MTSSQPKPTNGAIALPNSDLDPRIFTVDGDLPKTVLDGCGVNCRVPEVHDELHPCLCNEEVPRGTLTMPQGNRWHPVMLPDDYLRKMRQDLSEVEAQVEAETRCEPVMDDPPPPDDEQKNRKLCI